MFSVMLKIWKTTDMNIHDLPLKRKMHSLCDFQFSKDETFEREVRYKMWRSVSWLNKIWSFFWEINLNSHLYVIPIVSVFSIINIISFSSTTTANNTYDNNTNYCHIEQNHCEKTNCSTILLIGIICVRTCCIIKILIHFLTNKLYVKINYREIYKRIDSFSFIICFVLMCSLLRTVSLVVLIAFLWC
jgi:hypothetical protein